MLDRTPKMLDFLIWARRPRQLNRPRGSRCPRNKLMYPQFQIRSTYFLTQVPRTELKKWSVFSDQWPVKTKAAPGTKAFTDH